MTNKALKIMTIAICALPMLSAPALADRDNWRHDRHHHGKHHHWKHDHHRKHRHHDRGGLSFFYFSTPGYYTPAYYPQHDYYTPPRIVNVVHPYPHLIQTPSNAPAPGRYCREYHSNARVGDMTRQTYGTACMQPDGAWEIAN